MTRPHRILVAVATLLLAITPGLAAQDGVFGAEDTPQSEAGRDDSPRDYSQILLINGFLPGTAQIALGHERMGRWLFAGSIWLGAIGNGLLIWDLVDGAGGSGGGLGFYREGNRSYLFPPDDEEGLLATDWRYGTGLALSIWGSLLSSYSQWHAYREVSDITGAPAPRQGSETLRELLVAPYQAEHLFTWDVFPVFPLTVLGQLDWDDLSGYGDFFAQDTVDFWGLEVSPWAGLALNTAFTFALVHANATAEEILYRGIQLETGGRVRSSLSFGAAHLPNMLIPGVSIEDTLYQTLFATLFGFYAAGITMDAGYDIRQAVALHFWHNVVAFTTGYLSQPTEPAIAWQVRIAW